MTLVSIPAGDIGWKLRNGKWTWRSPRGTLTKALVKLDPATGSFTAKLSRLNFPFAPASPFLFSVGIGSDGGSISGAWSTTKVGTWKFP